MAFGNPVGKLRKYQVLRLIGLNTLRSSRSAMMMSISSVVLKFQKILSEIQLLASSYKVVKSHKCIIWTQEGQVLAYAKLAVLFL